MIRHFHTDNIASGDGVLRGVERKRRGRRRREKEKAKKEMSRKNRQSTSTRVKDPLPEGICIKYCG